MTHLLTTAILPLLLLLAASVGAQPVHPTPAARADTSQSLVADAMLLPSPDGVDKYVFLPVTIGGKTGTLILDTGAPVGLLLSGDAMAQLGMPVPQAEILDSLTLGSTVVRQVPIQLGGPAFASPPGLPPVIGLMGNHMLAHYDLLFDGPTHRVRLYAPPTVKQSPQRLPPGIAPADCAPIVHVGALADRYPGLAIRANGHTIMGVFDSGANATYMNLAAAKVLEIHQSSPHVHRVPPDSATSFSGAGPQKEWVVTTGLVLQVGDRAMPDGPVEIFQTVNEINGNRNEPELDLGTELLHDRRLFVSYSSGRVCLGAPNSSHSIATTGAAVTTHSF